MAKKHKKAQHRQNIPPTTNVPNVPKDVKVSMAKQQLSLQQKILSRKNIIAASLEIVLLVGGELLGHISPYVKIAAWLIAILVLIWAVIPFRSWLEKLLNQNHRYVYLVAKQKEMAILSISPILILAILLFVFAFQPLVNLETPNKAVEAIGNLTPIHVKQPNTVIRCCIQGNTYHIWAQNGGDKQDAVVITLSTSWVITDWYPIMGASFPTLIEGGTNANFITFKIDELIPNIGLDYIVETYFNAEQPRDFTAWSEETGNVSAIFIGKCPYVSSVGPVETIPP